MTLLSAGCRMVRAPAGRPRPGIGDNSKKNNAALIAAEDESVDYHFQAS
jgi:hypothetical protein